MSSLVRLGSYKQMRLKNGTEGAVNHSVTWIRRVEDWRLRFDLPPRRETLVEFDTSLRDWDAVGDLKDPVDGHPPWNLYPSGGSGPPQPYSGNSEGSIANVVIMVGSMRTQAALPPGQVYGSEP